MVIRIADHMSVCRLTRNEGSFGSTLFMFSGGIVSNAAIWAPRPMKPTWPPKLRMPELPLKMPKLTTPIMAMKK